MNSKYLKFLFLLLVGIAFLTPQINAEGKGKEKKLSKTQGLPNRTFLNINNISTQIYNDGNSDIKPDGNSGVIYPKGSGKGAVFQSGFIWGALISGDPQVRVGGSTYSQGLQPGKILSPGVAESPDLDKNRIYRVRPDVFPGGPEVDLTLAAIDEVSSAAALRTQYEKDWTEWPVADGAPFNDVDSNGVYNPNTDIPGVPGADQTIWFVANDLDANKVSDLYGADPLGIEMQATLWAYAQAGALGNMFFRKYVIINKSNDVFNDMIVSMWSDVDLGNSTDDFAGCDTTLSLGYVYNATNDDATYSPLNPPAVGFDFFQGPIVPGEPTDTAIFNGKYVAGKVNLPMTAFYYFARGDPAVTDPTLGDIQGSTQFYNFMQGKIGITGQFFVNPQTNQPTTFALPGDPQTGEGWIDGQLISTSDRRIGSASGPFQMAPGDTQEVVVAEIVAGATSGVDNIGAIGLLKTFDQKAQEAYDAFFILPAPPKLPDLQAVGLDNEVMLNWGSNSTNIEATESHDFKGFTFEGYNVYQLPSQSAGIDLAKRLATYDVVNGLTTILGPVVDAATGLTLQVPQQFGSDGGIQRYYRVTKDAFTNGQLINGIRYYFAVTSYAFNPDSLAVPNNLENPLAIVTVIPHEPNPGIRYTSIIGDTLQNINHAGPSDGGVVPIVVDPSQTTGHNYKVSFADVSGETKWSVTDVNTGTVVVSNEANQQGPGEIDEAFPIVDGMLIKVVGPPIGMKEWDIPNGTRRFSPVGGAVFGLEGFSSGGDPTAPQDRDHGTIGATVNFAFGGITTTLQAHEYHDVLLKLAAVDNVTLWDPSVAPADEDYSLAYRYVRSAANPPAKPEFAPWITNSVGTYPYQGYIYGVPFSAWDMETDPPTRLAVGHFENNQPNGLVDGRYWPGLTDVDNGAGTGPREFCFIFATPYTTTPDPQYTIDFFSSHTPLMWVMTCARRADAPWEAGDEFAIFGNNVNTASDEFTFTAPGVTNSSDLAKVDADRVNVFPNPYYGVNSEELNKYNRFVTFSHLPSKATIRIFNLAGVLVQTIQKDDASQFIRWDLANDSGLPVASGLYLAHIEMPDLGVTKILKVAIIQEQQILDRF